MDPSVIALRFPLRICGKKTGAAALRDALDHFRVGILQRTPEVIALPEITFDAVRVRWDMGNDRFIAIGEPTVMCDDEPAASSLVSGGPERSDVLWAIFRFTRGDTQDGERRYPDGLDIILDNGARLAIRTKDDATGRDATCWYGLVGPIQLSLF